MVFEGQAMEGLLDLVCGGILGYRKKFVVVVHALQADAALPLHVRVACAGAVQSSHARTLRTGHRT